MKRRLLAIFLSLTLMLSLVPSAWAVENEESSQETVVEEPETELIEGLQARINALPDAAALAEMDEDALKAVYNEVQTIYDALDALSTEEVEALELTPLETAAAFFTEQVAPLDVSADIVISGDTPWDTATMLTENLTVNSGATLTIGAQVTISGDVTISGGGTIKRGEDFEDYMIVVPVGSTLTLENIIVDGGAVWSGTNDTTLNRDTTNSGIKATSAMIYNFGELLVTDDAVLQNNDNTTRTGAIATEDKDTGEYTFPSVTDKVQFGGAVLNGGEMRITGGWIRNNSVAWRGAGVASYGIIEMTDGTVQGNFAQNRWGDGGAFYLHGAKNASNEGSAYCTISGGQLAANKAGGAGGAVCADGQSILNVSGGNFENNAATTTGGGINVYSSILNMSAGTISGNSAAQGGGLNLIMGSKATITGGNITSNKAENGGGIQVDDNSELDASDVMIEKNQATKNGGGIYAPGAENKEYSISLNGVSIKDNKAENGVGAGICAIRAYQKNNSTGTLTLKNCTIEGNQGITGGGVYLDADITATMDGGEISGNSAISRGQSSGGGICVKGTFTLNSGKISNNVKDGEWNGGAGAFVSGTFTMNGGEVSGNIDTCTEGETHTIGGGAFYVMGGTLNILGGSIIGNASYRGGAITFHYGPYARGTVNITGGTITGNYCTSGDGSAGGAIYMPTAKANDTRTFDQTVKISGNPVITGNYKGAVIDSNEGVYTIDTANATTENNIYLSLNQKNSSNTDAVPSDYAARQTIVLGELTSGASIGVTTETSPAEGREVQITTAETDTEYYKDAVRYFIPDAAHVIARANETGKYVELAYTADNYYTVTLHLSHASVSTGNSTTMVKDGESCTIAIQADEGYTLPEVTREGVTYVCSDDKTTANVTVKPTENTEITIAAIPKPTDADFTDDLVTVQCLNPAAHPTMRYGLTAAAKKYTKKQVNATEYSVTYDADAFAVHGHSLYSADKLNWTLTYDGSKWNLAPKTPGVDDVVRVTHAPTTYDEVTKFIDGRTDVIHTSCVNGETATCAYGLMVAFMNPDHVVSVEQEKDNSSGEPIRGSYIATLKMDQFAAACAKVCNGKSFADSPRAHDVRSKNPVQWRFELTQAEVGTDTGTEKQYVWSAEPVEADKDDVCQVAHRVVLTFQNGDETSQVEYKYNTTEITNNVEVPTPTREGYTFIRWLDADGNAFDRTANVTEDHTYNDIKWKPIKYRVIFNANAGGKNVTGTMEDQVFTYDQQQTLNANQFVCTDSVFDDRLKQDTQLYEFGGWNTAADGSGDTYADKADFTNKSVRNGERITLYAQWKHVTKTLTYHDEVLGVNASSDVDIFSKVIVNEAPTGYDTTKYIFKGWRSNVDGLREVFQAGDEFIMPNTDVTLTAVWEEIVPAAKADLTYVDTVSDGKADAVETEVGTWVTVKAAPAAVDGKTFKGWKSNIGGTVYQPDDKFQMPATDVTLTAVWEEIVPAVKHKVTYQNENLTYAGDEHEVGSIVKVERPNPPRSGYTFTGWRSSHEGRIYQRGDTFVMPDTDVILTAQWQKNPTEYTVMFMDGNRPVGSTKGVEGALVPVLSALTKDGYSFIGWKCSVDGKIYEADTRYTMPAMKVTMTAVWQADPAKYTVTYDLSGGEGAASDSNAYVEGAFVTVTDAAVTKDGFIFAGWRSSFGGTVYRANDTFQMPGINVTLTAQWQPEEATYTVSTSIDGVVTRIAAGKKANEIYTIAVEDPTKDGHTFTGWLLSSTGTIVHNGDTFNMPAGNVVLTAQWRVAITGNVYILAMDPEHGVHEKPYSAQLTAKKDNAYGDPVAAGDVQFVLVDADGHADTSRKIGHGLILNADGSITGTANGAGEVTFRVRLANAAGDFVSDAFEFTIVIDTAPRNCTVTMEGWTYGDEPNKPVVTLSKTEGTESYTYFYKAKGADDNTYTTEVPVNAGDYTVKVVVAKSANYKSCENTADFTIRKALITSVDPDVTAPVACEAAQSTIADGNGYTGTIAWNPADATFQYSTVYTATVVLTPDSNHKFDNTTTATNGWALELNENGTLTLTKEFPETAQDTVKTPVIRPNGGRFYGSETITITCPTDGADIYYTLDGTTPTTGSKQYTGAFKIKESTTVKAIAVKANYIDSAVATAEFTKRTGGNGGGGSGTVVTPVKPSKKDDSLKFNTEDHFAYVNGYPDGTVKPTGDVTRAEVAAILYRVMDADCVKTYETTRCSFSDVVRGDWFNLYVATLENAGVIVDTRTNGKFRPNEAITRAELAAMLAQFADIKSAANFFNDVSARHWASDEIAVCAKMGWINGYPDGSFRPDATITRAEMMAMINRALGRTPKSADDLLSGMKTWRDNANVNAWYYLDVQEATNSHTYTKSGSHETWKKLR